jgi:hypothetical protein
MAKLSKPVRTADDILISKIVVIRGQKVMFDRDLAELYKVKSIRLREQVKRNSERFPVNFMFQLTEEEVEEMVSQFAIPSKKHLGGYLPYAFTEHGILMLANVLHSVTAIKVSLQIIEIFVRLREIMMLNKDVLLKLEKLGRKVDTHDENIQLIFKYLKLLLNPPNPPRRKIGFIQDDR